MIENPIGVILAGGRAKRLHGQDKGLIVVQNRPLIAYTIDRLKPQVSHIVISANRNIESYRQFGYQVIADELPNYQGPLSGLLSVMKYILQTQTGYTAKQYLFITACDIPLLPTDFVERIKRQAGRSRHASDSIYMAHDGQQPQQLCACIPVSLLESLNTYVQQGESQVLGWINTHNPILIDYTDRPDMFCNINTSDDIHDFEQHIMGK